MYVNPVDFWEVQSQRKGKLLSKIEFFQEKWKYLYFVTEENKIANYSAFEKFF